LCGGRPYCDAHDPNRKDGVALSAARVRKGVRGRSRSALSRGKPIPTHSAPELSSGPGSCCRHPIAFWYAPPPTFSRANPYRGQLQDIDGAREIKLDRSAWAVAGDPRFPLTRNGGVRYGAASALVNCPCNARRMATRCRRAAGFRSRMSRPILCSTGTCHRPKKLTCALSS
jgi:hypothetical protein